MGFDFNQELLDKHLLKIDQSILLKKNNFIIFELLDGAFQDLIGHKLFTVLRYDKNSLELERIYTNNPLNYPLKGIKKITNTDWSKMVLVDGKVYIGYNSSDIKSSFPDYELIEKLGCRSVMNIPLILKGNVVGSVNLLNTENWYNDHQVFVANILSSKVVDLIK
tara:strand:- start:1109 stop:1603 length:495 start_codon:yes stop_codon:yes gene_type:complete